MFLLKKKNSDESSKPATFQLEKSRKSFAERKKKEKWNRSGTFLFYFLVFFFFVFQPF